MGSTALQPKSNKLQGQICHKWPVGEMQNLSEPTKLLQHSISPMAGLGHVPNVAMGPSDVPCFLLI